MIDRGGFEGYLPVPTEFVLDVHVSAGRATADSVVGLVRVHHGYVWRLCRRLGLSESDSDDVVQQVFIIAAGRLADIQAGRERSFLYGVALNVIAKWRHAHVRRREDGEEALDELESGAESLDDLSDQRRARRLLDAVLQTLPGELRVVFVLYEIEQQTVSEIAEALALPVGTAASRLRRARELFQAELGRLEARRRFQGERR
jgi:RNA polymerase sigma-70 factor (ECF subfamily)